MACSRRRQDFGVRSDFKEPSKLLSLTKGSGLLHVLAFCPCTHDLNSLTSSFLILTEGEMGGNASFVGWWELQHRKPSLQRAVCDEHLVNVVLVVYISTVMNCPKAFGPHAEAGRVFEGFKC